MKHYFILYTICKKFLSIDKGLQCMNFLYWMRLFHLQELSQCLQGFAVYETNIVIPGIIHIHVLT